MGPPRRNRSDSSVSPHKATSSPQPHRMQTNRTPFQPAEPPPAPGMSPSSRYSHNLKVLRRRDPSIISIFDQFSHVCIYHHNGERWEKQGYEGSMFLYERNAYPPYGFYILNRMGMDDYIQRLYPEDDIGTHGNYLMLRSYPEYTKRRMASVHSDDKFDDVYTIPNLDQITAAHKGTSVTIGLWIFATDAREPMMDVMIRLHSYIKKNLPYPEQFRYGPDRPPPPNLHSRTNSDAEVSSRDQSPTTSRSAPPVNHSIGFPLNASNGRSSAHNSSTPFAVGGVSELDKLFAKIGPPPTQAPASPSKLDNPFSVRPNGSSPTYDLSSTPAQAPTSGLALLNTIFASANPSSGFESLSTQQPAFSMPSQDNLGPSLSAPSVIPHHPTSNHTQAAAPIYSPIPTSTSLPQILNQDVISSLLGLPSRSSSSSSKDRYEGDNEAGASDGGTSDNSGAFDAGSDDVAFHDTETPQRKGVGVVLGDVTPRPTLRPELGLGQTKPRAAVASANASPLAASARTASPKPNSNLGASRPLKPFEADSALWPYPRAPIVEDEEIVELDFADTGALSDMSAFHRRAAARRNQGGNGKANGRKSKEERAADSQRERDEIEKSWDVPMPIVPPAPAPVAAVAPAPIVNGPVRHPDVTRPPVSTVNAGKVDPDVARQSVDAVVTLQATLPSGLERNQFVREVLTLIHTDKTFVDKLYQDYMCRLGGAR